MNKQLAFGKCEKQRRILAALNAALFFANVPAPSPGCTGTGTVRTGLNQIVFFNNFEISILIAAIHAQAGLWMT